MFLGPYEQGGDWQDRGIAGVSRFLKKVWSIVQSISHGNKSQNFQTELERLTHKTIKKVTEDIENLQYNTAIAALMVLTNNLQLTTHNAQHIEVLLKLLSPFAPHMAEELWEQLGHKTSIHDEKWPEYDPAKIKEQKVRMAVQVNGRVRAQIEVDVDAKESVIKDLALKDAKIQKWLAGKEPTKVIVVPQRVINIVTST
jgi:leucyl-tRNA synthetase